MFVNNSAIAVRVVILSVLLLVWLVATLVQRHYDKLRKSAERGSAPVVALPWWVRLGDVSYPVADPATLRASARESRFGRDDLVWPPGGSRWIAASHVEELRSEFYVSFVSKWKYDLFLKIWPVYLIVVMTAGLVIIAVSFDLGLVSAISSLRWKSTTARIIRSAVSEEDVGPHGYAVIRYRPTIEYEYLVSGKTYVATRRDFERHEDDDRYPDRARAEAITAAFPLNDRVTVYFEPDEPEEATLDRCEGAILAFIIGASMVAAALLIFRAYWRRRTAGARAGTPD